jgi:hypothetical protein
MLSVAAIVVIGLAGCASLPPTEPARDLKTIAGTWEGWGISRTGHYGLTRVVNDDGTWEMVIPVAPPPGPVYRGAVRIVGGKYLSRNDTTGSTATWTLHEGDGQRVLVTDGIGEYTRAERRSVSLDHLIRPQQ